MGRFFGVSSISAGFIAVLVGYTSSAAIVFQAASAAGAGPEHISSWLLALGMGMGCTCIGLSLYFRSPVLTAWSTPGAALLATALVGLPMSEAVGAFLVASALITLCGITGWVETLMKHIPKSLVAGMLAVGYCCVSGSTCSTSLSQQLGLSLADARHLPRGPQTAFALHDPPDLLGGLLWSGVNGLIRLDAIDLAFARPTSPPRHSRGRPPSA